MSTRTFTVKRSEWCRGCNSNSALYQFNKKSERCCLGFYGNQLCGLTDEEMKDCSSPESIAHLEGNNLTAWGALLEPDWDIFWRNTTVCGEIMDVNDSVSLTDKEREAHLTTLFADIDVTILFVD